ncbi:MAG TPA: caspase family protein, partial [Blastocatellia bacterium]|nr:caspase family protein [Blastocatellia bacterium]
MAQRKPISSTIARWLAAALLIQAVITPSIAFNSAAQERGQTVKRPADAKPEQRLALVIGNSAYKEAPLANPVNDAQDVAAALKACGFEVLSGFNRNQREMKELIRDFGQKLRAGGVGIFYFAGHGAQVNGRNYLFPIGAVINSQTEVEYETVEAGFVLAQMEEARNRLNVVILDACRNNPYARSFSRGRSDSRGLAGVSSAPSGTLIAYATAADDVAADGNGRNGLFTGELLTQLKTPGLTLTQVFQRTRTSVRGKSNGKQTPFEYSSVEGEDFYFIPTSAPPPAINPEQQAWERAKQRRTLDAVRGFLTIYPDSPFEKDARALLTELEKNEKPTVTSNPPAVSAPSALTPIIPLPRGVNPSALAIHRFITASVDDKGNVTKFDGMPAQQYSEDLGNGVRLEMVAIKDNRSERNATVTVSNFWIGKFEITQAQWRAVIGNDPSQFGGNNLPVESISWVQAEEFCRKLNAKLGLKDDKGYRLPTEAEWEYAARAGSKTEFAFGDTITPDIVNYNGNFPTGGAPRGVYREKTVDVGRLGVAN